MNPFNTSEGKEIVSSAQPLQQLQVSPSALLIALLKKDFLAQKKFVLFAIGYSIFIFVAFNNPVFSSFKYTMGATAIAYIFIMNTIAYDEKNNAHLLLNSLPISRRMLITSRYLMFLEAGVIGIATMGLIGMLFSFQPFIPVNGFISSGDVAIVFFSLIFLTSIYFPFYVHFGSQFMRMFNLILFLVIFFTPSVIVNLIRENPDSALTETLLIIWENLNSSILPYLFITGALLLFYGSYQLSTKLYEKKEF